MYVIQSTTMTTGKWDKVKFSYFQFRAIKTVIYRNFFRVHGNIASYNRYYSGVPVPGTNLMSVHAGYELKNKNTCWTVGVGRPPSDINSLFPLTTERPSLFTMKSILALLLVAFAVVSTSAFGVYTPVISRSSTVSFAVKRGLRSRYGRPQLWVVVRQFGWPRKYWFITSLEYENFHSPILTSFLNLTANNLFHTTNRPSLLNPRAATTWKWEHVFVTFWERNQTVKHAWSLFLTSASRKSRKSIFKPSDSSRRNWDVTFECACLRKESRLSLSTGASTLLPRSLMLTLRSSRKFISFV